MNEVPFHTTVQGRRYYEHSVPELIRQLTRVGDALERLVEQNETKSQAAEAASTEREDRDGQDSKRQDNP